MPAAARLGDMHTCPKIAPGHVPHKGGPTTTGEGTVLIGGMPAARVGDSLSCHGPTDSIVQGEPTVLIGNRPAARIGDATSHGGVIIAGCETVLIGSTTEHGPVEPSESIAAVLKGCAFKLVDATQSGAAGIPR